MWEYQRALGLLAAAGCGDQANDDFSRFQGGGTHLKTPSEVRQEAEAKYGKPGKKAEAKPETNAPAEPKKNAPEK